MGDSELQTIKQRLDEPKLNIGDTVALNDGRVGVVVARYTPMGGPGEMRYILRVESAVREKRRP